MQKKPIRVFTNDDVFLRQLGLNDTYKAVMASSISTASQLELDVRKALSKGLNEEQAALFDQHTAHFAVMFETTKHGMKKLQPLEKPLEIVEQNARAEGGEGKFWFVPDDESPHGGGERVGLRSRIKQKLGRKGSLALPVESSVDGIKRSSERRVFGVPLSRQFEHAKGTPAVLNTCVHVVTSLGLKSEGIFRLSASQAALESLKQKFDAGESPDINDEHLAAALLKSWLRELPEPLCTFAGHPVLLALAGCDDEQRFVWLVRLFLRSLPACNRVALVQLLSMIGKVAAHSEQNKMTPENLAVCLGPNLCRRALESENSLALEGSTLQTVIGRIFQLSERFADLEHVDDAPPDEWQTYAGFGVLFEPVVAETLLSAPALSPRRLPPPMPSALPPPVPPSLPSVLPPLPPPIAPPPSADHHDAGPPPLAPRSPRSSATRKTVTLPAQTVVLVRHSDDDSEGSDDDGGGLCFEQLGSPTVWHSRAESAELYRLIISFRVKSRKSASASDAAGSRGSVMLTSPAPFLNVAISSDSKRQSVSSPSKQKSAKSKKALLVGQIAELERQNAALVQALRAVSQFVETLPPHSSEEHLRARANLLSLLNNL